MKKIDKRRKHENIYEEKDDCTILKIHSEMYGDFEIIIDTEDVNKIKQYHWGIFKAGSNVCDYHLFYVSTNTKETSCLFLHRFITNCPKGMVVDHIDGNTMNTKKENLRICTRAENCRSRKIQSRNKSGHTGVQFVTCIHTPKWLANIRVNWVLIHLGYTDTYEEAVKLREAAELKYFGEYIRKREDC